MMLQSVFRFLILIYREMTKQFNNSKIDDDDLRLKSYFLYEISYYTSCTTQRNDQEPTITTRGDLSFSGALAKNSGCDLTPLVYLLHLPSATSSQAPTASQLPEPLMWVNVITTDFDWGLGCGWCPPHASSLGLLPLLPIDYDLL